MVKPAENLDAVHISCEQGQACFSGQPVGGGFDTTDFEFIFPVVFVMLAHRVLYLLGVRMLAVTLVYIIKDYKILSNFKGLFLYENRSG